MSSKLTCGGHLRDSGAVRTVWKPWLIVIDVLHLNDELRLWLQRETCVYVNNLGL